jgi:hypothetical protein
VEAMLDADEQEIVNYLKSWPRQFVSGREICRRAAGKMRYREEPYWAVQPLGRLVEKKVIETDAGGHYRLIPDEKKQQPKKWISPQIKKILEQSGKTFDGIVEVDEGEESQ